MTRRYPRLRRANPRGNTARRSDAGDRQPDVQGDAPRLPHERDESADQAPAEVDAAVAQAGRDVARGLVDTDRGPAMDAVYRQLKDEPATR